MFSQQCKDSLSTSLSTSWGVSEDNEQENLSALANETRRGYDFTFFEKRSLRHDMKLGRGQRRSTAKVGCRSWFKVFFGVVLG
mmetsp:Transcript_1654/g.2260  ORF Transcript_1654/g.2260 Transcript_1654/m.2260 type:complete len:83 (+) Transcript_1654:367-615(+)